MLSPRKSQPMKKLFATLVAVTALPLIAQAQQADPATQDPQKQIERYRELLADGNPAELLEMRGEDLWKQKRGPKNASMEACDLDLGAGKVAEIGRASCRERV